MERISVQQMPSVKNENLIHLNRYVKFINSRPERKLHQKGFHTHHIYPKSMAKKNNIEDYDGDWNLIELTIREHYIAHLILWKCGYNEMAIAFHKINTCKKFTQKISSRQFESLLRDAYKGENNPMYGKKHSDKSNELNSIAHIGKTASKETKAKQSKSLTGKKRTEETKNLLSLALEGNTNGKANKGKKRSIITRNRIRNSKIGKKNPKLSIIMTGRKATNETREKQSLAHSGKVWINSNGITKLISSCENIPDGWCKGRK